MSTFTVTHARRPSHPVRTQPFRILVASSGEPSSMGAIRLATLLARRRSASVHALIVATPFPHTIASVFKVAPPVLVDDDNRRAALDELRSQLATVRGTAGWTMRATSGFAPDSIVEAAERWPASLVVLGTGQHGLVDRLLGSETAVKVAMKSMAPVLAVPEGATALPTRAIVAVDFSDTSISAALTAAAMLGSNGALTLLYASPLVVESPGESGSLTDLYTTGARDRLAAVAADIQRRTRRRVSFEVRSGGVVDRLLEVVAAGAADMIALGGHEPSFLERLVARPVRADVLRAAGCCVLVAPARAEE